MTGTNVIFRDLAQTWNNTIQCDEFLAKLATHFHNHIVFNSFLFSSAIFNSFSHFNTVFKVCHSSAFQTISRRSDYIKIINYNGSISANLNRTKQTKQHAMKKSHSYSNRNKIYKGLFFVVEGFWAENVQNLQFLLIQ